MSLLSKDKRSSFINYKVTPKESNYIAFQFRIAKLASTFPVGNSHWEIPRVQKIEKLWNSKYLSHEKIVQNTTDVLTKEESLDDVS